MAEEVAVRPERIVVASHNLHKIRELGEILTGVELVPPPDGHPAPREDGETFAENALIKARAAFEATGEVSIADDSGIAAAALAGRPGVRSARYAGPEASDEENLALLLTEVDAAGTDRRVEYVCAIALVGVGAEPVIFEGRCPGVLADSPRGEGGFGYDPAFIPDATGPGDRRTMAELEPELKHRISHRGRAARDLARHLAFD